MDLDYLFDEGITAAMRGETDKAVESFLKVVGRDPGNVGALHQLGKAYLKKGDLAAAIDALARAAERRPNKASIRVDLGQAYLSRNEPENAQTEFTKVLGLEGSNIKAITGLAQVFFKRDEWDRAAAHAKLVLADHPMNFAALFTFGAASSRLGHVQQASDAFKKAGEIVNEFINLKPEQMEGHFLAGEIYLYQGMLDQAVASYESAAKCAGNARIFFAFGLTFSLTDLQSRLGSCYKRLGKSGKVRETSEKTLEREPDNEADRELSNG